jgi:hypothetical protein
MSLTDTFVRQVKQTKPGGDKYSDGKACTCLSTPPAKKPADFRNIRWRRLPEPATVHYSALTVMHGRFARQLSPKLIVPATRHPHA